MTGSAAQPMTKLDEDESWALLSSISLGRLAISIGDVPDVFPVNFVVQRRTVLIRTAEGTKLSGAAVNRRVAFEADLHDVAQGWSVVVKGIAHLLQGAAEIQDAERAQALPWITTRKERYIRILPSEITGRRFHFGGEMQHPFDFS